MQEQNQTYKKILITVNGEPIERELIVDSVTYAPVSRPLERAYDFETPANV
ncbi:hypothetical protein Q5741_12175 [Paenibacillus sp. JX-17]|uniref:Uncharacterized protein n=1 Tax=Paenibacillus lacisoli TaxID=3064525 RepID=A0ABT9CHM2_9BACL|nr:hypothetical protein [Paenibacillus sp. JX-17]MDO7907166.1 hypothetical protein [Paenibacillus sp. JX-17]